MIYCKGNLWDFQKLGFVIVIPTNGVIDNHGNAVMGAGLAKQAKLKYPGLPVVLGEAIRNKPNNKINCFVMPNKDSRDLIITFQTKYHWRDPASTLLIDEGCRQLVELRDNELDLKYSRVKIALPRLGCGCGGLNWKDVHPILDRYLDDRFLLVGDY